MASASRENVPLWVLAAFAATIVLHVLAGFTTGRTIELMRTITPFTDEVRAYAISVLPFWRAVAYSVTASGLLIYAWPVVMHFRCGLPDDVSAVVRRRAIGMPAVVAVGSIAPWVLSVVVFPTLTLLHFGRWSFDLMSQQVLSPLVNGFLAATASYLVIDWIFRTMVIPHVFPRGHVAEVPGALTLGLRSRLLIFLAAVAFLPLFTMLGLARTAQVRYQDGIDIAAVVEGLARGSTQIFVVYAILGVVLTLILARTFTVPLAGVVGALRRVHDGDLTVKVAVESSDELGRLQEGVNEMVGGLREKDRIMAAFGRVVEPAVRDRLLAGDIRLGGEARRATVMFCDLRGFTSLAEQASPHEVVGTLNEFFTVMTTWVRECGGFVDKFIGDALLVVFGLFGESSDDEEDARGAAAAVRCALGARDRLEELNRQRAADGKAELSFSIALHTGEVVAGTIGALDRHEYTVIGDTVNIAARLQQVGKDRGDDIVVTTATIGLAGEAGEKPAVAASDSFVPRGRNQPVSFVALG